MEPKLRINTLPVEKALDHLGEARGGEIIKHELRVLAQLAVIESTKKRPPNVTIRLHDFSEKARGFIGFLVGAHHPSDNPDGEPSLRVPNWLDKGTLGRRRPRAKKPGRSPKRVAARTRSTSGIKPRRYIHKVSKTRQSEVVGAALLKAARACGFDSTRWGG